MMTRIDFRSCALFRLIAFAVLLVVMFVTAGVGPACSETGLDSPAKVVKKIELKRMADGTEAVYVFLDGFQTPDIFSLNGGNPRIVCDFPNLKSAPGLSSRYGFSGNLLRSVRVAPHRSPSPKLRIVLDLVSGVQIDVLPYFFQEERIFALTLSNSGTTEP